MSFDLFQREPFRDDTAKLPERWAQEGNNYFVVNQRVDIDTSETMETLKTGTVHEVDYISEIILTPIETTTSSCDLWIGAGPTQNARVYFDLKAIGVGNLVHLTFKTPLKLVNSFGQSVNTVANSVNTASQSDFVVDVTIIGWTEPLNN